MGWITAAVAVGSSLLQSSQKDNSWKDTAREAGRNKAQLDAARGRAVQLLPGKVRALEEGALNETIATEAEAAATKAQATVEAAAAGAAGASVDATLQDIDRGAAVVKNNIEKQRRAGLLQVNQDYEDILWEAENQKYDVHVRGGRSVGRNLASAALAGVGGYFG